MGFQKGRVKTGGRQPGVLNHATRERRRALLSSGLTPLDFLTEVYRNPNEPTNIRVQAATTVASFVYPKLSSVDLNSHNDQPLQIQIIRFSDLNDAETSFSDRMIDLAPDAITDGIVQDDD